MDLIVGASVVALFPFALAAVTALMTAAGTDLPAEPERKVSAEYQPMHLLTSRSA